MLSFTNVLASLALFANAAGAMPTLIPRASPCSSSSDPIIHTPSSLHKVFPQYPDASKTSLGFHLESYDNSSQVEQVVVFTGIPSDAKDCSIGWQQGERNRRTFIVKGSDALTGVKQLSGVPKGVITYDTIEPFDDTKDETGAADFTNWDNLPAQGHIVGGVDCAESLYFKFALRNPDGNTKVFLNQDKKNGLYISYTC